MKYVNVGTPGEELYVPDSPLPIIERISVRLFGGKLLSSGSRLIYPDKDFCTRLKPEEVVERLERTKGDPPRLSEYKCPEHGRECGLRYCVRDGQKGGFCLVSDKFYPEEELKGE